MNGTGYGRRVKVQQCSVKDVIAEIQKAYPSVTKAQAAQWRLWSEGSQHHVYAVEPRNYA